MSGNLKKMNMNFLKSYPDPEQLKVWYNSHTPHNIYLVNGHIHTPYSFSSFNNIDQAFKMASDENIKVLGINDFYVADGFDEFATIAQKTNIFPLFNIELIGLDKTCQDKNIRINDPNNPGRIYLSGKGLDYPFSLKGGNLTTLEKVVAESQKQLKEMVYKANNWFISIGVDIKLDYQNIKIEYAKELVRERHLAKAIRVAVFEKEQEADARIKLMEKIFGNQPLKSKISDIPSLENEIRGNLLKAGGKAFVAEDEKSFLPIEKITEIIRQSGGIPCYPVLLDDNKGNITDFEKNFDTLYIDLIRRNIYCVELIPGRNSIEELKRFSHFFENKGFVILYGTEHNTPDMQPLTVTARNNVPLDDDLKRISFEGACLVAAHQYLRSKGKNGFSKLSQKTELVELGKEVIEYFLQAIAAQTTD
jgi:hypothetical protein